MHVLIFYKLQTLRKSAVVLTAHSYTRQADSPVVLTAHSYTRQADSPVVLTAHSYTRQADSPVVLTAPSYTRQADSCEGPSSIIVPSHDPVAAPPAISCTACTFPLHKLQSIQSTFIFHISVSRAFGPPGVQPLPYRNSDSGSRD